MKGLVAALLLLGSAHVLAADHVVVLKKKVFSPESISVKVGDSVEFRNDDPVEHAVASQSEAKSFDFDPLPPGESRKVTFDKPGTVEVGCSMHDGMHLTILVAK